MGVNILDVSIAPSHSVSTAFANSKETRMSSSMASSLSLIGLGPEQSETQQRHVRILPGEQLEISKSQLPLPVSLLARVGCERGSVLGDSTRDADVSVPLEISRPCPAPYSDEVVLAVQVLSSLEAAAE